MRSWGVDIYVADAVLAAALSDLAEPSATFCQSDLLHGSTMIVEAVVSVAIIRLVDVSDLPSLQRLPVRPS